MRNIFNFKKINKKKVFWNMNGVKGVQGFKERV